jgi:hypothetical protein
MVLEKWHNFFFRHFKFILATENNKIKQKKAELTHTAEKLNLGYRNLQKKNNILPKH